MSTAQLHDPIETGRLLHRRDELMRRHETLSERVALFANLVNRQQLDQLTNEVALLQQRLVELGVSS